MDGVSLDDLITQVDRTAGADHLAFCGAHESAAQPLVHGPGVAICGTCTTRSAQALQRRTT